MSPAASVDFRVRENHQQQPQPNSSPYCQYPNNPNFPSCVKFGYGNASGVGNGSESCGGLFNSGRSVPGSAQNGHVPEVRSKPRLDKVKKGFGTRSSRSSSVSASADSGFNPFQSGSQSSNQLKDDSGRMNGFQSSTKISATSGEPHNFSFVFGENSSLGDIKSKSDGTYNKQREGSIDRIGNAFAPEISGANSLMGEVGRTAGQPRCNAAGSLLGGDHSFSGSGFGNKEPSNKENLETVGDKGSVKFDNFVFGNERVNGSMKSEGQRATSGGEGSAETHKSVEFQNCIHSSFVFGATSTKLGLNYTNRVGTWPTDHEQTSSHPIQAGFVFASGESTTKADIEFRCQYDNAKNPGSREGQEENHFVLKRRDEIRSSHRAGEAKMPDQVTAESSAHQGSSSGDRCSKMGSFEKPSDAKLSEDLKKLNIDNLPKAVHVENANDTFVFKSSRSHSTSSTGKMSNSDKVDKMETAGNNSGVDELYNEACVRPVDENLFVFGASTLNSSSFGDSSHCSANCQFSHNPVHGEDKVKGDVDPSSFPSFGLGTTIKSGTYAKSEEERLGSSSMDFKVPQWDAFSFSANMYSTLDGKSEHGVRSRIFKDKKPKKTKEKSRKHDILKQKSQQETGSGKSSPHINTESTDCYSPMDFSPYEESAVTEQCSPEGSVKLNPPTFADINCTPLERSHVSVDNKDVNTASTYADSQSKLYSGVDAASGDTGTVVHSNASHEEDDGSQCQFASNSGQQVIFTASTSTQGHSLPIKRQHKKKYKVKAGRILSSASAVRESSMGTSLFTDKKQVKDDVTSFESKVKLKSMTNEEKSTSALSLAEEACEKWRLRGNQAYKSGDLHRAEDFYTWGINCIPSGEESGFSVKPLVLCYSNRAATRMALGRVREALEDCLVAVTLDPGFLKAQIRAANCHLMLGELEEAIQNFNKCIGSGGSLCLDRQHVIAASDGLQRAQKVAECISHADELLKQKTSEAAVTALGIIAEGISISLYSEKLYELKAEALCLLQKYEDAIQLCEKTLDFANKNFPSISSHNNNVDGSNVKTNSNLKLWRSRILAKCYFHLGKLEAALGVLDKYESGRNSQDSDSLAVTITELLKYKNAGNEAFRSGKHAEAVEHYTSAVSCTIESRPFAAVCFCNRSATYQALGQIADAISDCSVAMALDETYIKAVSRRANLHEKIRDYRQAASDLQKLVSILEKRSPEKAKQSGSGNEKELEQAYQRLSSMEGHAKKEISLDLYLILGVKRADTASEIKKAYRKAALKHHPDKAGQLLVRSESGHDGRLWKEIADSVDKDSDRLFKMIGEAYAVLSDPEKREEYDLKEDMRSASSVSNVNRGASRRESDFYSYTYGYPFERSTNRRQWQGGYKSRTYSRWE